MVSKTVQVVFFKNGNVAVHAVRRGRRGGATRLGTVILNRREHCGARVRKIDPTDDKLNIPTPPRDLSKSDRWRWRVGYVVEEMERYCE
ncbi:MAG: hypothetical protein NTW87_06225 [Planctomycetota bacterium]|nr:hypothetical protein [Planctomycetota bacterium]